jgi:hypothetical protein
VAALISDFAGYLASIRDAVTGGFRAAWDVLFAAEDGLFPTMLRRIQTWINDLLHKWYDRLGEIREAIRAPFQAALDLIWRPGLSANNTSIFGLLLWQAHALIANIIAAWGNAFAAIRDIIAAPFRAAREAIEPIYNAIHGWFATIQDWWETIRGRGGDIEDAAGQTGGDRQQMMGGGIPPLEPPTLSLGAAASGSYGTYYAPASASHGAVTQNFPVTVLKNPTETDRSLETTMRMLQLRARVMV